MSNITISPDVSGQNDLNPKAKANNRKILIISLIVALSVFVILSIVFIALYCVEKANSSGIKYSYVPNEAFIVDNSYTGDEFGGAAIYNGEENIMNSPYFPSYDFYNGVKPTDTLILLNNFKTFQQQTDVTCGAASCLMVLNYYGITDVTEKALAEEMNIGENGAPTQSVYDVFDTRGFEILSSKDHLDNEVIFETEADLGAFVTEQLNLGRPIIVESLMWDGHWTVIIGYDTMGREDTASHVLIMADPWDTTDHYQDGYYIVSLERFFAIWKDYALMPDNERMQQYVVPYRREDS